MSHGFLVAANRLLDGRAVFLNGAAWVVDPAAAQRFEDKSSAQAAAQAADPAAVVGPEIVALDSNGALVRRRERIRAQGPTVRTDLGRQAEPAERV